MERSAIRVAAQALARDANPASHESLIGKTLGDYRIESPLGSGGMGEVYLAHDSKLNRKAALKILPRHFVADAERAGRFRREAFALSALNHPNLITIYEVGEAAAVGACGFKAGMDLSGPVLLEPGRELREARGRVGEGSVAKLTVGTDEAGVEL